MLKISQQTIDKPFFFDIRVDFTDSEVIIKFPKIIQEKIKFSKKSAFCTIINGTIQISGEQPTLTIPVLPLVSGKFLPISSSPTV